MVSIHNYDVPTKSRPKYSKYSILEGTISTTEVSDASPIKVASMNETRLDNDALGLSSPHNMITFIGASGAQDKSQVSQTAAFMSTIEHDKYTTPDGYNNSQHRKISMPSPENPLQRCPLCNRRQRTSRQLCRRVMIWTQFAMIVAIFIFVVVLIGITIYAAVMVQDAINQADHAIRNNAVANAAGRVKALFNRIRPTKHRGEVVEVDVS